MPVVVRREVLVDELAEDGDVEVAQRIRDDVVGHRRHKDHRDAGNDARHGQGQRHLRKDGEFVPAQVGGRLEVAVVQLFEGGVQGQDHEGQEVVHHADDRVQVILRPEHPDQVEQLAQRRDAQHEVDPHGQDEQHQQHVAAAQPAAREDVRHGVGDRQADGGRNDRDGKAHQQGGQLRLARKEVEEVRKGEGQHAVRLFRKGVKEDEQHGDDDEQRQEQPVGDAQLPAGKMQARHVT